MIGFEYKVVPAPIRGLKGKGIKGTPARFANALQTVMNEMGAQGWEYQRTDTLPVEERQGLTGKTTSFQHLLVFRRQLETQLSETVDVAALIEDQSDIAEDTAPEPDFKEMTVQEPHHVPTVDTTVEATDKGKSQDASLSLKHEDGVSETLNPPFVFPWNRRAASRSASDEDRQSPRD